MNRDMDLARRIMRQVESASPYDGRPLKLDLPDVPADVASYHLQLLSEAGLVEVYDVSSHDGPHYLAKRLTWQGHEFLDASRNDTVWAKAKDIVVKQGGAVTFEILQVVLKRLVLQAVHIPPM
jgi:hypothetical protein